MVGAYLIWGLFPLYWKLLEHVAASEIVAHRILWSMPILALLVIWVKSWRTSFITVYTHKKQFIYLSASSLLIAINWVGHVYGVNKGWVVEVSMGYFLSPLISVLAGYLFFKERLIPLKKLAILFATAGVIYYIVQGHTFPWIGLVVAFSFAGYGVVRKLIDVDAVPGLLLEALLLLPIALFYIVYLGLNHHASFLNDANNASSISSNMSNLLLILSGAVTVIPLVLFTAGVRLVSITTTGILLYIAPTIQFLLGVWLYGERVDQDQLMGFMGIWIGLALYSYALFKEGLIKS